MTAAALLALPFRGNPSHCARRFGTPRYLFSEKEKKEEGGGVQGIWLRVIGAAFVRVAWVWRNQDGKTKVNGERERERGKNRKHWLKNVYILFFCGCEFSFFSFSAVILLPTTLFSLPFLFTAFPPFFGSFLANPKILNKLPFFALMKMFFAHFVMNSSNGHLSFP